MFIDRCISLLLSAVISVNSTVVWLPTNNNIPVENIKEDYTVEEVIDITEVDVEELPVQQPVESEIIEVVEPEVPIVSTTLPLSDSEIDLITLVTMAEAEGESEEGKRLVIDVILNRYDSPRFPNTIEGVIYAKNAFECMWNGRIDRCYIRDDIRQLVIEELQSRTNSNIHYFRTNHYHGFGTPVVQVGNHYFSTY